MSLQYNLLALLFAIAQTALAHTPGSPDDHDHDHDEELSALGNVTLDACAALGEEIQYNQNLHIGGIFILLAVSGLGVISTSMLSKFKTSMVSKLLLIFKMFGIGVLASTAWMHILPSAFEDFGNPCLDAGWQKFGVGYVGLFGLIAAFIAQQMEMLFVGRHKIKSTQEKDAMALAPTIEDGAVGPHSHHTDNKEMTVILLEAGIMFHSVIIGLTLGVAADDEFTSLLAAICFHQLSEGGASGSERASEPIY
ncbi:ZIP zinc transporter-domain-containing protein [Chytriomyces cf. hyalinus JEL632]|nr:ZIP zinc transporter-domain-containing protein [Chytriomyces cf. hyalinus JEL632]